MSASITRRLTVRGLVQGVGYRNYIEYKAGELGVSGWVRNRRDGTVEAVVQGAPAAVESIIECAQRGPRAARVTAVEVSEADGCYTAFAVKSTE
jgi:acylphosphatase